MKNGANEQGFALVITHYNYELRFVVSGLRETLRTPFKELL